MAAIVYAHTVEGLFYRAVARKITPALKAELLGLGLDLDHKPRDLAQPDWAKVLAAAVRHLFGGVPADDGFFQLGTTLMAGYGETLIGKALFATLRLLGPDRACRRVISMLQNGNNYVDGKVTELGPHRYELWVNECNGNPHYVRGVLAAGLVRAGAKNLVTEVTAFDGHQATYRAGWE